MRQEPPGADHFQCCKQRAYQFFHALGLLALAVLLDRLVAGTKRRRLALSPGAVVRGSCTAARRGAAHHRLLTPIGGLALIAAGVRGNVPSAPRVADRSASSQRDGQGAGGTRIPGTWRRWLLPLVTCGVRGCRLLRCTAAGAVALRTLLRTCARFPRQRRRRGAVQPPPAIAADFYDVLALRYLGKPMAYWQDAVHRLIAYSFAHNFAIAAFTAARCAYRLYPAPG